MNLTHLKTNKGEFLEGPLLIKPNIFQDDRGSFFESWNQKTFNQSLSKEVSFNQDNLSKSSMGVLRGLHYQLYPSAQGKLVRCTSGEIFDVAVDIRNNSPTFGQWLGVDLTEFNHNQLWIPEGFAHGFLTLSEFAIVEYKVTTFWNKELERAIIWNDISIGIKWPIKNLGLTLPYLSEKDSIAPSLSEAKFRGDLL
tara:strand:+ start:100 stop:687 length:588 start_codon:yes stop_codon:yes gene_type:complete